MEQPVGLRERKKLRTRTAISSAAIELFLERGYDAVSVAEVAEAAEVSKRTLFAYFATKDDLVLHRFADHEDEPARVVRDRGDRSPLQALHEHLLDALRRRDPISGLCDHPAVVAFNRMVMTSPALSAALVGYTNRSVDALTAALQESTGGDEPLTARLAAGQIVVVQRTLATANQVRIVAGHSADDLTPTAVAEADHAYALLGGGLIPFR